MSDPRFAELLEKYWAVAYQQGTEGRNHDDATGAAEGAEWDLMQYIKDLAKDRDYWKVEAEGEAAKVAFRDKMTGDPDAIADRVVNAIHAEFNINLIGKSDNQRLRAAVARALKEKP